MMAMADVIWKNMHSYIFGGYTYWLQTIVDFASSGQVAESDLPQW